MAIDTMTYNITFRDFQFLQGYMARRVFVRNRQKYGPALLGVVLCASFLALVIFISANPFRIGSFFGFRYPQSFYFIIIFCLIAAILCLTPAIRLRLKTLRMQVSDDGPFLGSTSLIIEPDGLVIDRKTMKSKYLWAAFRAVEISKNAVILPLDHGIGIIIPASAFPNDAARYEFASVVSKHLENPILGAP